MNLIKKGDKVIIPVNGEFSSRLAQQIEWAGGQTVKIETKPGVNATFDQVKEAFDNNSDVKAFYCVWNETSTGTMLNYLDRIKDLTSRNDSYYVLDGVSIVGGEELHMDKWGIDIAMTGAPEGICLPTGNLANLCKPTNQKIHGGKSAKHDVLQPPKILQIL